MDYRQRITEEAANMFRKYGIRAVTMDMLSSQLGMSKRTIYEIFRDKDELLTGVLRWMSEKQKQLIKKVFAESENVIAGIFRFFELMDEHYSKMSPAFKLDIEKYHYDIIRKLRDTDELPYNSDYAEMIKRGIEEGVFRSDINVAITNKCVYEVIRMSVTKDNNEGEEKDRKDVFRHFYINYLRGISTPKGLIFIDFYEKKQRIKNQNDSIK